MFDVYLTQWERLNTSRIVIGLFDVNQRAIPPIIHNVP